MAASRKPLTSSTPFLKLVLNGRPDMSANTTLLTSARIRLSLYYPPIRPRSHPRFLVPSVASVASSLSKRCLQIGAILHDASPPSSPETRSHPGAAHRALIHSCVSLPRTQPFSKLVDPDSLRLVSSSLSVHADPKLQTTLIPSHAQQSRVEIPYLHTSSLGFSSTPDFAAAEKRARQESLICYASCDELPPTCHRGGGS